MGKKRRISESYVESGAKKSDGWDSQEEVDMDGGSKCMGSNNGVRYSARVMEKQEKLRRESSPGKTVEVGPQLSVTVTPPSQSSRPREESGCLSGVDTAEEHDEPESISVEKRKKRNWELWSQDDKQLFFEALNEFGKDFDAIQNHLASKLKGRNKGPPPTNLNHLVPKNKDQVRHFYYRTWNKISKFLTFPKEMKKAFQELYGLINYGELRKKQRVLNMKSAVKLSELVEKGTTTIKVRGKTCRIKTPVCRALKRLNRVEEVEQARMPLKVVLELVAKDGKTWRSVQALAHNPRIRVTLSLQRTVASLINFFEDRWKSPQDRLKEKLLETFGGRSIPRLRFVPVPKQDLSYPIFKVSEATSSAKISLRAYTENVLGKFGPGDGGGKRGGRTRHPSEHERSFEGGEVDEPKVDLESSLGQETTPTVPVPSKGKDESGEEAGPSVCVCPSSKGHGVDDDFLAHVWDEETIRRGWTAAEAGVMTFGELYLTLGQSEKIQMEYYWTAGEPGTSSAPASLLESLLGAAAVLKKKKSLRTKPTPTPPPNQFTCPNCSPSQNPGRGNSAPPGTSLAFPSTTHLTPVSLLPHSPHLGPLRTPPLKYPMIAPAPRQSPALVTGEETRGPPKPFLALPKGNRRLGRPAKRIVIPRALPLLRPKGDQRVELAGATLKPLLLTSQLFPLGTKLGTSSEVQKAESEEPGCSLGGKGPDGPITLGTNEFEDLLKPSTKNSAGLDPENTFSLSSFMEISLPESTRNQATVCLSSDKFLTETADADISNSSIGLTQFLNPVSKREDRTDEKKRDDNGENSRTMQSLSDGPWLSTDPVDLSLSSLLVNLDTSARSTLRPSEMSGSDMTFQSLVGQGDGNLNFLTKYTQGDEPSHPSPGN